MPLVPRQEGLLNSPVRLRECGLPCDRIASDPRGGLLDQVMSTTTITQASFDEVLAAIKRGELDPQLDLLQSAIRARRDITNLTKGYALVPGDIVVFNKRTRPGYMIGLRAKVLQVNQVTAYVEMLPGQDAGRFQNATRVRVPFALIDKAP